MASGLRTVSIKFNGDAKGLKEATDKAERGLSSVADKADNLDSKSAQATDSLGALSSGFELVGLDQYATGLQSVALATDFMSGVGTGLNLIMNLSAVQFIRAKVAALAYAVQQKAVAIATKTWTGVQWLLNAALTANPIGVVVALIVGLIAIIVLAWQRSTTFREVVTKAFAAVKAAAEAVGKFFTGTLWPGIKWVWDKISSGAGAAKDGVVKAFNTVVGFVKGLPKSISKAASGLWDKISSGATAAKNGVVGAFNTVVGFVKGLPKAISGAAGGMWDGIKNAFKSAINWVISKWNNFSIGIPAVDTHIPGVGKVGGFSLDTPNIPLLARGGTAVRAGLSLVGENGPEFLHLPRGASVVPLDQGGGDTIVYVTIDGEQLQGRIDKTVRANNRELKRSVKAA